MLPIGLGGVLGDAILARLDYAALFTAAAALSALSLLASLPLRDRPREPAGDPGPTGFAAALMQRDLLPMWWIGTIFATALAGVFAFLKLFVMETGLASVGGFFTAYSLAAVAMRLLLGWVPDRVGPKRALLPSLAALAAGFVALALARSARDVLVAGVLCGVGHGFAFPILFGMVVTRARSAERGSAMAVYTALFDAGVVIGGPLFGLLIRVGGFSAMFAAAALTIATGTLVFALWDRGR
jgi:predicted MFS family arabinose efflux permease